MNTVLSRIRNRTLRLGMVQFFPGGRCYSYGVFPTHHPEPDDYVIVPAGMNNELKLAHFSHFGMPSEYANLNDEINYKCIRYVISHKDLEKESF